MSLWTCLIGWFRFTVPDATVDEIITRIGGEWVKPSSDAQIDVIDSVTEEVFFSIAEAQADDISRAVAAARVRDAAFAHAKVRGAGLLQMPLQYLAHGCRVVEWRDRCRIQKARPFPST